MINYHFLYARETLKGSNNSFFHNKLCKGDESKYIYIRERKINSQIGAITDGIRRI